MKGKGAAKNKRHVLKNGMVELDDRNAKGRGHRYANRGESSSGGESDSNHSDEDEDEDLEDEESSEEEEDSEGSSNETVSDDAEYEKKRVI